MKKLICILLVLLLGVGEICAPVGELNAARAFAEETEDQDDAGESGEGPVGSPVIPPHTHTGGTATCTEPAICAACGQPYGEPLGHQEETIPGKAATCTEPGLTDGVKCSVCGAILTAQEEIAALGHDPETIPATATCTQAGLSEYTVCARCGVWLTGPKEIPALGHKEEPVPATEPTCTAPGYSAGVKCSRCGETLSGREETDPALGHDWGGWETVATKDGKVRQQRVCKRDASHVETRTMKGAVDGVEWVDGSEKDDLEMLLKMTPDQIKTLIRATESAMNDSSVKRSVPIFVQQFDNYIERILGELVRFGRDGNVVMDSATVIKKVASQIIRTNYFEHTYTGSKYFKVTIAAAGKYHVTYIGPVLVDDDSEWDEWGEWEVTTPATCTEKGEETRVDKKDSNHVETREIPATGHTEEPIPGKAATCTEPGLTDGVKCSVCGEVLTAQEEIPALGHDWGEWETVKGEDGLQSQKRRVCKRDSTHTETKPDVGTDVGGSDVTGAPATQIPQDAPELASLPQGVGTLVGAWDIKMSGTTNLTFTYPAMPTGAILHVWHYEGGAWHEEQGNQTGNSITVTVNTGLKQTPGQMRANLIYIQ
ncbi:MAG: hypothetical protein IKH57_08820 [Clostridia bacterium]|nr:hypothetical protein [Clostridia bacterium]